MSNEGQNKFTELYNKFTDDIKFNSVTNTMIKKFLEFIENPILHEDEKSFSFASCTGNTLIYKISIPLIFNEFMHNKDNSLNVLKEIANSLNINGINSINLYYVQDIYIVVVTLINI